MHHPRTITPDDVFAAAMLASIRRAAKAILGDVSDASVVRLTLAALCERDMDDHRQIYRLLRETYVETDPAECAGLYDAIADEARRLEGNERQAAEEEADAHAADETFMLHADFRRTA